MISSAFVIVSCNICWCEEKIDLTCTARGWDERGVKSSIESLGWKIVDDNTHYCEDCKEEADAAQTAQGE